MSWGHGAGGGSRIFLEGLPPVETLYLSTILLENIAWVSNKPAPFSAGGGISSPNTLSHTGIHVLLFDSSQNGTKSGPAVEATFPRALVRFTSVSLSPKFSRLCLDPGSPNWRLPLAARTDLTPFFSFRLCSPCLADLAGWIQARLRFQKELRVSTL